MLAAYAAYAAALAAAIGRGAYRGHAPSATPSRQRPQRILIVGASGGTGRELVRQALERGQDVTALVRTPAKFQLQHPRLTIIQGDVLDYSSVLDAVRGQDAVMSALGHRRFFGPTRTLSQGTMNLLRAMETHRVERFVCETSLGLGDSVGRMGVYYTLFVIPVILPFYFSDKARQERAIAQTSLEWIIVRPGALRTAPSAGRIVTVNGSAAFSGPSASRAPTSRTSCSISFPTVCTSEMPSASAGSRRAAPFLQGQSIDHARSLRGARTRSRRNRSIVRVMLSITRWCSKSAGCIVTRTGERPRDHRRWCGATAS